MSNSSRESECWNLICLIKGSFLVILIPAAFGYSFDEAARKIYQNEACRNQI